MSSSVRRVSVANRSTAQYFSFDALKYRSPIGARELAGPSGRDPFLNLACPGLFDPGLRFLETLEQLGSDLCAFVERQLQRFS